MTETGKHRSPPDPLTCLSPRPRNASVSSCCATACLKQMPGCQAYRDFAVQVDAELPAQVRLA